MVILVCVYGMGGDLTQKKKEYRIQARNIVLWRTTNNHSQTSAIAHYELIVSLYFTSIFHNLEITSDQS